MDDSGDIFLRNMLRVSLLVLLFFLWRAISWDIAPRIYSLAMVLIVLFFSYLSLRSRKRDMAVNLFLFAFSSAAAVAVATSGGATDNSVAWFLIVPCCAGLLGGTRLCLIWTGVTGVFLLGFIIPELYGFEWLNLTPTDYRSSQRWSHIFGQWVLISALIYFYTRTLSRYEYALKAQLKALSVETEYRAKAEAEARASEKAKSHFLANMSHELRTPLNSVIGHSRRLLRKVSFDDERNAQAMQSIARSGEHLVAIVNELLDIAGRDGTESDLTIECCALKPLVNEMEEIVRRGQQVLNIDWSKVAGSEPMVYVDRQYFIKAMKKILELAGYLKSSECEKDGVLNAPSLDLIVTRNGGAITLILAIGRLSIPIEDLRGLLAVDGVNRHCASSAMPAAGLGLSAASILLAQQSCDLSINECEDQKITIVIEIPSQKPQ